MLRWALVLAATSSAGCGLTLDYEPPMPDTSVNGALDSSLLRRDGGGDAAARDGGARRDARSDLDGGGLLVDAAGPDDTGLVTPLDAELPLDATEVDDAAFDDGGLDAAMTDAAVIDGGSDAAVIDGGSDAAMTLDASVGDASTVVCMGVHPIVGPPRTCNPGSCLCVGVDTCFGAGTVASCCTGTFVCAPPPSDCMATHPIIGPPRTCASGNCYCANPDACFPADRADRCCAVAVMCVP